jgi:maleamate amidohydrolase
MTEGIEPADDRAATSVNKAFGGRARFGVRPALLLVDPVRAYVDPSAPLFLRSGAGAIEPMVQLLSTARGTGVPTFFSLVTYAHTASEDVPLFARKVPALEVFTHGNPFGAIDPRLAPRRSEPVVRKKYASAFFGTALAYQLSTVGVDTVVIGGFSTSGCVRATATDALQTGFAAIVVADAVADRTDEIHKSNLRDLDAKYADVVGISKALEYLSEAGRLANRTEGP